MNKLLVLLIAGLYCYVSLPLSGNTCCHAGKQNTDRPAANEEAAATDNRQANDLAETTVGFPGQILQRVIPGGKLVVRPIENRDQPLILRILETYQHGSNFRYDLEFYGLEPGDYDLLDYLQHEDGSIPDVSVAIPVRIMAIKPMAEFPSPNELTAKPTAFRNYYLATLLIGGTLWLIGLAAILFAGRGRLRRPDHRKKPVTVADRLRPLVEQAIDGNLDTRGQAELERVLEAFWRTKLRLKHVGAGELRNQLRSHPEASVMLQHMDSWLHRPGESGTVDIANLLKPYQSLAAEDLR